MHDYDDMHDFAYSGNEQGFKDIPDGVKDISAAGDVPAAGDVDAARQRRPPRFSTICAKDQVLKLNIDKVTVILRRKSPSAPVGSCAQFINL